jgi:hypothetical protein
VYDLLYLDLGDALDLNHCTWASWELPGLNASSSWLRVGQELRRCLVSDSDLLRRISTFHFTHIDKGDVHLSHIRHVLQEDYRESATA